MRTDKIVKQWLIANYEKTASKSDKVSRQHLGNKLSIYLASLGEEVNRNRIGRLVTSTFGNLNFSKVKFEHNYSRFYTCLKEKGLESNGSQVSSSQIADRIIRIVNQISISQENDRKEIDDHQCERDVSVVSNYNISIIINNY